MNIPIDQKFAILAILTTETVRTGYALDSSSATNALRDHGYGDLKRMFGAMKVSDVLREIPGVTILPPHYAGGVTTVVIDALANADDQYKTSVIVEQRALKKKVDGEYSGDLRRHVYTDLHEKLVKMMDALSIVLDQDWPYTQEMLCDDALKSLIHNTFLDPRVDLASCNWGNREVLINAHEKLAMRMNELGLGSLSSGYIDEILWRKMKYEQASI